VHPVDDLVQGLGEIPGGEGLTETFAPFIPLPVAFTLGILFVSGFINGGVGRQLVF
jgi:hypothetical protein